MSNEYVDAVKAAFVAEGIVKAPEEPKAPPAPPAEGEKAPAPPAEVKPPEGVPDSIKQSFTRLAQEKATFRAEQERLKPHVEALKVFDPGSLAALAKAKASGDPVAALAAMGFSHTDYVSRFVDGDAKRVAPAEEPAEEEAPLTGVKADLAEFKAWKAEQAQQKLMDGINAETKGFKHIEGLGRQSMVLEYLTDFIRRTGGPPSEDFKESVKMAAQAVEDHLKAEAQKWSKVLTPSAAGGTVPAEVEGTSVPPPGPEAPTMTNDAQAKPRALVRPVPKSAEEYRSAAVQFLKTGE